MQLINFRSNKIAHSSTSLVCQSRKMNDSYFLSSDFIALPNHKQCIQFCAIWVKRLATKFEASMNRSTQFTIHVSVLESNFDPTLSTHLSQQASVMLWTWPWNLTFSCSATINLCISTSNCPWPAILQTVPRNLAYGYWGTKSGLKWLPRVITNIVLIERELENET